MAGPSVPKNAFFGDQVPAKIVVAVGSDFNPFRHAPQPHASAIRELAVQCVGHKLTRLAPSWPYTGRPVQMGYMPPGQIPMGYMGGMEDDMASPQFRQPQMMPGMQSGWYPPQNRYPGQVS